MKESHFDGRRVFTHAHELEAWLGEILNTDERARLKAFLSQRVWRFGRTTISAWASELRSARLALGALWVDPICEKACVQRGVALREVDYRGGRQQSSSCVCSNGEHIACHEADITLGVTTALVIVVLIAGAGLHSWLIAGVRARSA